MGYYLKKNHVFLSGIFLLLLCSCKECPSEPEPDYDIFLSVDDYLCDWVKLKVTLPDSGDVNQFALDRNDSTIASYICVDNDTVIVDHNLEPDTDYIYRVRFLKNDKTKAKSDPVNVRTLPTTSHSMTWESHALGEYWSDINDVWIVDENNIWVVGEIVVDDPDSTDGTGWKTYNAARWDGTEWELFGIYSPTLPLANIFYFSENDIWVTSHCFPYHWNGNEWVRYHLNNMGFDVCVGGCLWGTSSSNMYFVGSEGSIVHYDGNEFLKMNSGTDIILSDIWGVDEETIFASGGDYAGFESVILKYNGTNWQTLFDWRYPEPIIDDFYLFLGVWATREDYIHLTGDGTWLYDYQNGTTEFLETGCKYVSLDIRGLAENDYFICSSGGEISHFNGLTWNKYDLDVSCVLSRIKVTENLVVSVGNMSIPDLSTSGVVLIGRR